MIHLLTLFTLAGICIIADTSLSFAQKVPRVINKLPPPPPVPTVTRSNTCTCSQPTPVVPKAVREYVYQAPQTQPSNVPSRSRSSVSNPKSVTLYRVDVIGDREILLKVKKIEPFAFIRKGDGVIQAGLFQQQEQAQQRLRELKLKGFSVRVISVTSKPNLNQYANFTGRR